MRYPEYIALSLFFFGGAGYFIRQWFKHRHKIRDIILTPTSPIGSLLNIKKSDGRIVEIKGSVVATESLLTAPYTQKSCVFFHSTQKNKFKEVYRNMAGERATKIYYKVSEELRSNEPFFVEDKTGKIAVYPQKLEIEGQWVRKIEKPYPGEIIGGFGSSCVATLEEEMILSPKRFVYVIGELSHNERGAFIGTPLDKTRTALISVKTEESILEENQHQIKIYIVSVMAMIIIGLICVAMAI